MDYNGRIGSSPDGRSRAVADGVVAQVTEHLAQPFPLLVAASLLGVVVLTVCARWRFGVFRRLVTR